MPKPLEECTAEEIAVLADEYGQIREQGKGGQVYAVSAVFAVLERLATVGKRDVADEALSLLCDRYNRLNDEVPA